MAKYRLKTNDGHGNKIGRHCIGPIVNGHFSQTVQPGSIIESDQPLDQLFRNKFELISNEPKQKK